MEKQTSHSLTPQERQANIDRLITAWKVRKAEVEQESIALLHSAEGKAAIQTLKERNAARGIVVPGL